MIGSWRHCDEKKVTAHDAVQELMPDSNDEIHAAQHHPPDPTSNKADERIRLLHHLFSHLVPPAMEKLPKATEGEDELRGFKHEQIENAVGGACDTCAQSRMLRKAHTKSANDKFSTTEPVKEFGDCVSADNAGPLAASFIGGYRYLTIL